MKKQSNRTIEKILKVSEPRFVLGSIAQGIRKGLSSKRYYPFMVAKEIFIVRSILKKHLPQKCLEWGSGYSTAYFSKFVGSGAAWYSIEHDRKWYDNICSKIHSLTNSKIFLVEPEHQPWTDKHNDGAFDDLKSYILFPKEMLFKDKIANTDRHFDFILIDGRARKYCLKLTPELLGKNGVAVLHDANRSHYFEDWQRGFSHEYMLSDGRADCGGLFIASNENLDAEIEMYKAILAISEKWEKRRIFRIFFI